MAFKTYGCGGYARLTTGYFPICATRITPAQYITPNDVELPHRVLAVGYMGDRTPHRGIGIWATGRRRIAAQEHSLWRDARSRRCHRLQDTPQKPCRIAASVQGRQLAGYMGYAAMRLWMIYGVQDLWLRRLRAPCHRLCSNMRYAHNTGTIHPTQRCGITASRFSGW